MKTLGRALLILAVFALIMGITYTVVTAGTSSNNAPQFQSGDGAFAPNFAGTQRPEFHGERGGGGLMFGMIKNTLIVAIVVVFVVVPKGCLQKRRRTAQVAG